MLDRLTAWLFRLLAVVRRGRALHPKGRTFAGSARLEPGSHLADRRAVDVVVRRSRGAGLPDRWPDFDGVAIRFLDAHGEGRHQDLLLTTTAGAAPVLRHVLRPVRSPRSAGACTILPLRSPHGPLLFRLDPFDDAVPFVLVLRAATPLGRWRTVATIAVDREAPEAATTRFDPWTTGPELVPSGLINRLRGAAYAGSRQGRPVSS